MPWHRRGNTHGVAAQGSDAYYASPLRHLKAGAAAHSGGAAGRCRPYVGSRFSLKQLPRFLCGGMASAQGFLSTWSLEPTAIPEEVDRVVVSSPAPPKVLGAAADRTPPPGAGAPGASTKDKPASDRPSPRSVLVHTSTQSRAAPRRKSRFCRSERQAGWLPVADDDGRGPLPFKAKEFVSCYLSI